MTDNSFTDDQGNQGTTSFTEQGQADPAASSAEGLGTKLQQQIDVMQKRMGDKDTHIKTVESENQTLREKMADIELKLESMGSVEDALARMNDAKNSNQDTALDEDTLVSKVLGKMEAMTQEEKAQANFDEVSSTLTKTYGKEKVDEIVKKAADENGLSFDDMFNLAKRSPKAVYKMVGVNQSATSSTNPSHSTTVSYTTDNQTKEQKLAYYSKLRRENPKEYYSPATQRAFREACLSE